MNDQNIITRAIDAKVRPDGLEVGLQTVQHRGFGLHITPIVTELGHVGTQVDLVVPGWEVLAGEPHEEALDSINSFIADMVGDLTTLIENGLAESVVNYIQAAVTGEGYETPHVVVEDHPEPATDNEEA